MKRERKPTKGSLLEPRLLFIYFPVISAYIGLFCIEFVLYLLILAARYYLKGILEGRLPHSRILGPLQFLVTTILYPLKLVCIYVVIYYFGGKQQRLPPSTTSS